MSSERGDTKATDAGAERVFKPARLVNGVPWCPQCDRATGRLWLAGGVLGGDAPARYGMLNELSAGRRGVRWDRWRCVACGCEYVTQESEDGLVCAAVETVPDAPGSEVA